MENPLVSIIVPVYKAEKYLNVCVNSIIQQTYKNFECILIDDGSPDNSGILCDQYATSDNRFKVIHKSNGGVSSARNAGLDIASGDWITFIDSDDWVDSEYINEFVKALGGADLVVQGYRRLFSAKKMRVFSPSDWIATGNEITKKIAEVYTAINPTIFRTCWAKIYKRAIIDNHQLRYKELTNDGEDFLFILNYLLYVNQIKAIASVGYNYMTYQSTLTKTVFDIESYAAWQKDIIDATIEVDSKYGHYEVFADYIVADRLQIVINVCYLKNDLPQRIRLKTLSMVISLLTSKRLPYIKKKYFILKMHKILPLRIIDLVLYISCSPFRMPYKKIKKLKFKKQL
jgi:glycosyltransferase involved in cell wall biosynthesis